MAAVSVGSSADCARECGRAMAGQRFVRPRVRVRLGLACTCVRGRAGSPGLVSRSEKQEEGKVR